MRCVLAWAMVGIAAPILPGASDVGPAFEAAAVKPLAANEQPLFRLHGGPGSDTRGRFDWEGSNLLGILSKAYDLPESRISAPGWLGDARFTIHAKYPAGTDQKTFQLMLQRLLEERFHMVVHHIAKPVPAYDLVISRLGQRLKAVQPDPDAPSASRAIFTGEYDKEGFPVLPRGAKILSSLRDPVMVKVTARMTMSELTVQLGGLVRLSTGYGGPSPVIVDRTGLPGLYEFRLEFARVVKTTEPQGGGPTIFNGLERQHCRCNCGRTYRAYPLRQLTGSHST